MSASKTPIPDLKGLPDEKMPIAVEATSEAHLNENKDDASVVEPESLQISHIEDYKPLAGTKSCIYSMNELIDISKAVSINSHLSSEVNLPKKSFWRLTSRHPEIRQNEMGTHNGNGNKHNGSFKGQDYGGDKKSSRGKNARGVRRSAKLAKGDKSYVEEKDVKVNNDELLALEEEIKPTGNSISDFENWRAKMKELERKKKGQSSNSSSDTIERPPLANNGSSVSDFFNLQRQSSSNFEELEPQDSSDNLKSSHSRFSSFFNGPSNPKTEASPSSVAQPPTPKEREARPAGSSRVLSFFDNMDTRKNTPGHTSQNIIAHPPSSVVSPPVQEQTNSNFFQGLLNKGKAPSSRSPNDQLVSPDQKPVPDKSAGPALVAASPRENEPPNNHTPSRGPPGLAKLPGNKPVMSTQAPPGYPVPMPMNPYFPNTQHIGQPPAGFQPFQIPPPGVGVPQNFFGNQRQAGDFQRSDKKDEAINGSQEMRLPFMSSPHNLPPPGFPPMHGIPPGISRDLPMPSMMAPPPGFFPSQGPSIAQFGNPQSRQQMMNAQSLSQRTPPRESQ
ncbi:LADA_0H18668g1_1 [Lachancea dasiensis]|uniref:LADA_0H18668g1_1 n=1 Tax=Lachancea dasiensis TaxID=1072105 RepID=A0A1G4K633_9SACH|nr:LADA_0H18668g1_1 [Lachancea dasiensis]